MKHALVLFSSPHKDGHTKKLLEAFLDGLKGEEIPIWAQVVALADVYDALVSERVYKKAYPHDVAVKMILDGECGAFNPLLLECFKEAEKTLRPSADGMGGVLKNTFM